MNKSLNKFLNLNDYNFDLPQELIAQEPSKIRDHSRLFIYNTSEDKIIFDYFYNLHLYLPSRSLIVFNKTKVLPARIYLRKETGGKVEVLFLLDEYQGGEVISCIANKHLNRGEKLFLNKNYFWEVIGAKENIFFLKFSFPSEKIYNLLLKFGKTPIPKYIKQTSLSEKKLRRKYQSIFAEIPSSIAAPTASLHFTNRVLKKLRLKGIKDATVILNVGLGTFMPLKEKNILTKTLHKESFFVPPSTWELVKKTKMAGNSVIAVGTTTVRTLESFALGKREKTDLFIYPPFNFRVVDILITNFHLPRSSLIVLVDAFLKHKEAKKGVIDLYKIAVEERFRFFSFGDAMLII